MINSPEVASTIDRKIEINKKKRREAMVNEHVDNNSEVDSSFSEAQIAQIIEGAQMDLNSLKNNSAFKSLTPSQKAVSLFNILSKNLNDLLAMYIELASKDLRHAKRYSEEIKKIRAKQKILLKKIFGELEESEGMEEYKAEIEELFK